jgi:hypothetical protein
MLQRKVADGFDRKKTKLGVFTGCALDSCQPQSRFAEKISRAIVTKRMRTTSSSVAANVALKNRFKGMNQP